MEDKIRVFVQEAIREAVAECENIRTGLELWTPDEIGVVFGKTTYKVTLELDDENSFDVNVETEDR
jgi:hypothetical protein